VEEIDLDCAYLVRQIYFFSNLEKEKKNMDEYLGVGIARWV
jgi:hypothetical protein